MDKIFSVRMDESIIQLIGYLSRSMQTTKKKIIEEAIGMYAASKQTGTGGFEVSEEIV